MPPVHFKPRERRMLQDEFDCHTRSREPRRRDFVGSSIGAGCAAAALPGPYGGQHNSIAAADGFSKNAVA
jgi:hypothetical protein